MVSVTRLPITVIFTVSVLVLAGLAESVTVMPTVDVPGVWGVPVMVQLGPMVRPLGSEPETTVQLYGAVPPATRITPT